MENEPVGIEEKTVDVTELERVYVEVGPSLQRGTPVFGRPGGGERRRG